MQLLPSARWQNPRLAFGDVRPRPLLRLQSRQPWAPGVLLVRLAEVARATLATSKPLLTQQGLRAQAQAAPASARERG